MKIVVMYLDDDGYIAYKKEYSEVPDRYRDVVEKMINSGKNYVQVGDVIVQIMQR